jgi:hypothetical protein
VKNCLWNEQTKAEICTQFGNSLFTGIETGLFLNFEIDEFIVPARFFCMLKHRFLSGMRKKYVPPLKSGKNPENMVSFP